MRLIVSVVIGAGAFFIGVFGFAQIVGALQNIRWRPVGLTIVNLLFWGGIFALETFLVLRCLNSYRIAFYIGSGIAFLSIITSGRIE